MIEYFFKNVVELDLWKWNPATLAVWHSDQQSDVMEFCVSLPMFWTKDCFQFSCVFWSILCAHVCVYKYAWVHVCVRVKFTACIVFAFEIAYSNFYWEVSLSPRVMHFLSVLNFTLSCQFLRPDLKATGMTGKIFSCKTQ